MPTRNSKTTGNEQARHDLSPISVKQTAKITFAYSKHRTLQSITYPPEKKSVLEQAAFWHEVTVG